MVITMRHAITRAQAALAKEKDPKKRKALQSDIRTFRAAIEAAKKTTYKKTEEEETSEESGDETDDSEEGGNDTDRKETDDADPSKDSDDSGEGEEEESEESEEEAAAAKGKRSSKKAESEEESEEEASMAESEEEEESAEAEDDEEAKALLGGLRGAKRARARGMLMALRANAKLGQQAYAEVQKLRKQQNRAELDKTIDQKLAKRFITSREAKWLKGQPKATVDSFLATRKGPIVLGEDDAVQPATGGADPKYGAHLEFSEKQMEIFRSSAAAMGIPVEKLIENYKKAPRAVNGVAIGTKASFNGPPTGGN